MILLLKMSIRNIWRNPRRSAVTIAAVASGISAIMFLWGFTTGTIDDMRRNAIDMITGHVQVLPKGAFGQNATYKTLKEDSGLMETLKNHPDIQTVSGQVTSRALVGTDKHSRGALLTGVNPDNEKSITRLHKKFVEGRYLSGHGKEIILGDRLAHKIKCSVGDEIVVMAQDRYGMSMGLTCNIVGIFHSGYQAMDERFAYVNIATLQNILGLEGELSKIIVKLNKTNAVSQVTKDLQNNPKLKQHDVVSWAKIMPSVEQWAQYADGVGFFIMITVIIVVAISIMNTVLMSVMERTKEFGVMLAVGMSGNKIIFLVFLETVFLEAIGVLFGVSLGSALIHYFGVAGVSLEHVASALETNFMSPIVFTIFDWGRIGFSIMILLVLTVFAAIYPAKKAATLEPVKAIYYS